MDAKLDKNRKEKMKINFIKIIKIITIIIVISFLISGVMTAYSQTLFMFVSDIKPGMKGIGKTVFQGTKIENFEVEVVEIVSGYNGEGKLILARLNGKRLSESGGISAGMSGSPVYIEGKLIGAISYTWELSEHDLCLITPIEEMLELLEFPYDYNLSNTREYNKTDPQP